MGVEDAAAGQGGQAVGAGAALLLHAGQNQKPVGAFYDPNAGTGNGWDRQTGYDPNATNYNGSPQGLQDYVANTQYDANQTDKRAAPTADYTDANGQRANSLDSRAAAVGTLGSQAGIADMQRKRAMGLVPSIASQVADRNIGQATAAQGAQQASARGAAGLALAGQTAAGNISNATTAISNDAQINAGTERLNAENAAANTYGAVAQGQTNVRAGDLAGQGQDAQQAQFQAQQQLASRNANDQRAMGDQALIANAQAQQLAAKTQQQGSLAQSYAQQQQQQNATNNQNANTQQSWWSKLLSDERAKQPCSLGSGGGKMWSDENTKFMLVPGSKLYNPSSGPVDATGNSRDLHDGEFSDPGPSNVMASLKANSDYATRYSKDPTSDSFYSDARAKTPPKKSNIPKPKLEGPLAKAFGGSAAAGIESDPNAQRAFFDPVKGWQMPSDDSGAPDTIGKAALDRALASQTQQDKDDIDVDRDLEKQNARDARMFGDAVVAPGQAPKGYADFRRAQMGGAAPEEDSTSWTNPQSFGLNRGGANVASSEAPKLDEYGEKNAKLRASGSKFAGEEFTRQGGAAPGTEDFERSEPKPPKQAFATSDPTSFFSDDRVKLMSAQRDAFQQGVLYGGQVRTPDEYGRGHLPDFMQPDRGPRPGMQMGDEKRTPAPKPDPGYDSGGGTFDRGRYVSPPPAAQTAGATRQMTGFHRDSPEEQNAIAEANRSMRGQPYAYKPGFAEASGQKPGEVNVGPMAQNMEKSQVAGTAVKTDPATGLKTIDKDKAMKVMMSGIADLQRQQDETKAAMSLDRGGRR